MQRDRRRPIAGEGPPVVLIHGGGATAASWISLFGALTDDAHHKYFRQLAHETTDRDGIRKGFPAPKRDDFARL